MNKLIINAKGNGYTTEYTKETMTVGELINYLKQFEEDTQVYIKQDGTCVIGGITTTSFKEIE